MNEIQKTYALAKAAYDTAFENQNWEMVDKLEDPMLEAEFALWDWMAEVVVATGQMEQKTIDELRRHSNNEQWEKMIDMAMRLNA